MSKELRKYQRHQVHVEVELGFPSGETQTVRTRDVSEGGVFLVLDKFPRPVTGEVVSVTVNQDTNKAGVTFPSHDAIVIRQEEGGIGLAFIELELEVDDEL